MDELVEVWLALIGCCGLKCCEVAALRVEHIRMQVGGWALADACCRTGSWRTVPVGPSVTIALKRFIEDREQGPVFIRRNGRPYSRKYVSQCIVREQRRHGALNLATATALRHQWPNE